MRMPAPLAVDKEAVKMLVIQFGVSEAARQTGIPLNTLLSWSARGEWLKSIPRSQPLPPSIQPRAIDAINPSVALANSIREDLVVTRATHVRIARRAAQRLERLDDDNLIEAETADTLLKHAKHAALTGGWNADTRADAPGKAYGARQAGLTIDAECEALMQECDTDNVPQAESGHSEPLGSDDVGVTG